MASGRFLKEESGIHLQGRLHFLLKFVKNHALLLSVIGLIMAGCGTSGNIVNEEPLPPEPEDTEGAALSEEFKNTLNETRTEPNDVFGFENNVPEYFLKEDSTKLSGTIGNPFTGYRVQIISTRDISVAKSVASDFRVWAGEHIVGYFPQTYVTFDQPYYKVHIGNFQFYQRAAEFTQLIKERYSTAWVVHDRIDPKAVPEGEIRKIQK